MNDISSCYELAIRLLLDQSNCFLEILSTMSFIHFFSSIRFKIRDQSRVWMIFSSKYLKTTQIFANTNHSMPCRGFFWLDNGSRQVCFSKSGWQSIQSPLNLFIFNQSCILCNHQRQWARVREKSCKEALKSLLSPTNYACTRSYCWDNKLIIIIIITYGTTVSSSSIK